MFEGSYGGAIYFEGMESLKIQTLQTTMLTSLEEPLTLWELEA
ncbi:hypothetical protein [uncultured Methanobrevibacter sp.]|nr:hypothetical protein [uncultured Methanobrevibacter sp.]